MSIAESELAKTRLTLLSKVKDLENQVNSLKENIGGGNKIDRCVLESIRDTLNEIEMICRVYSDLQEETSILGGN